MKNVSNDWINYFNQQLVGSTDIGITAFRNNNIKRVDYFSLTTAKCCCLEALGFSGSISSNASYVKITFKSPISTTNLLSKIKTSGHYTNLGIQLKLYCFNSSDTQVAELYFDYDDMNANSVSITSSETISYAKLCIDSSTGIGQTINLYIDYIYFNDIFNYNGKDYTNIQYKAHLSPTNADLPYHEITTTFLGNTIFAVGTPMLFRVSIPDEYIRLGCGYYYVKEVDYDRKSDKTKVVCVDLLSTLTQPYSWGLFNFSHYGIVSGVGVWTNEQFYDTDDTWQDLTTGDLIDIAFNSYKYYNHLPTICVPNDIDKYYDGTSGIPVNRTVAETLQLIAQAKGTLLYLNGDNKFRFYSLPTTTPYYYELPIINVKTKVDVDKRDIVKDITIIECATINESQYENYITGAEEGILGNWQIDEVLDVDDGKIKVNFEHAFSTLNGNDQESFTPNATSSNFTTITAYERTYAMCYFEATPKASVISGNQLSYYGYPLAVKEVSTQVYKINNEGVSWTLKAELGHHTQRNAYNHLLNVAKSPRNFTTTVRFDPRFEIGDFIRIYEDNENVFKCFLTDINMNYNGGFSAELKGLVWEADYLPPIIKSFTTFNHDGEYELTVENPNDYPTNLWFYHSTTQQGTGYISFGRMEAFETKTYHDTDVNITGFIEDYEDGDWIGTDDVAKLLFQKTSDIPNIRMGDSGYITLMEGGELKAPQIAELSVNNGSFKIVNNNGCSVDYYISYNGGIITSGTIGQHYHTTITSATTTYFDRYKVHNLAYDLVCYFKVGDNRSANTIILAKNKNV